MLTPTPPTPGRPARNHGPVWGPGKPGQRVPRVPLLKASDSDLIRRMVVLSGFLVFVAFLVASHFGSPPPSLRSADAAPVGSADAAAVSSAERPRPFQGLLDGARDGLPIEELEPTDCYRTLLWNLKAFTVAEVTSHAEEVPAAVLSSSPALYRGRFVRASGVLVGPLTIRRLPKNEAGYENAWRGILVDTGAGDETNAYEFDLYERPDREFSREDAVVVEGVFLQTITYDARGGKRTLPFLQAKSIRPLVGAPRGTLSSSSNLLLLAAIAILSLPFLGLLVANLLKNRQEEQLVAALERARRRRPPLPKGKQPDAPPADPVSSSAPTPESLAGASPLAPPASSPESPAATPPAPPAT